MTREILKLERKTSFKWVNLFEVQYRNAKGKLINWIFASRKKNPIVDQQIDAVVIVPIVDTVEGKRLVVIEEYRVAVGGFEYGFPAGILEEGQTVYDAGRKELKEETGLDVKKWLEMSNVLYSAPGLSDESCIVLFAEVEGRITDKYQESGEDISAFLYDIDDINELLASNKKIGAKAWGILRYYSKIGKIE